MAQARRSGTLRKALHFAPILAVLAVAVQASPAASLNLPTETPTVPVKIPTVPVKAPTVPVKTPTVPVTVPAVLVKTPTVPVKVPPIPVKVPPVPVKVPPVPVKTPTGGVKQPTVSVKTPSVSAKTPAVAGKGPGVSVKAPGVSVKTTSPSGAPGPARPGAPQQGAARPSGGSGSTQSGSSGSSGSGASGAAVSALPLAAYPSPGVRYGELPASEGSIRRGARARIARRERTLKATVARLQGCLTALPESQRELLELRTGFGAARPLSPRATAARLHLAPARFAGLEEQAVRELSHAGSTHSCGRTSAIVASAMAFIGAGLGGAHHGATGGVEAVRYSASPIKAGTTKPSTLGRILGADIPPVASDLILVLLSLLAAGSVVAFVIADAAGQGPRHEQWRQRLLNRIRSLR